MAFHRPDRHVSLSRLQVARMIFVFAVAGFALLRTVPDAIRIITPLSVFGYYTNAAGTITNVIPRSPAAKAGLQVGDKVDVRDFNQADRKPGLIGRTFSAYNPIRHLTIVRDGVRMSYEIRGVPEPMETRITVLLRELAAFATIAIASLLAIVRPNRASLGFFHFVVGSAYPSAMVSILVDYPWRMMIDIVNDVLVSGSLIGLFMFSLGYPHDIPMRWRLPTDAIAAILWAGCAGLYLYSDIGSTYFALNATRQDHLYWIIQTAIAVATFLSFAVTLFRSKGTDQVRVAWVVAAFMVALAGEMAAQRFYPGVLRGWEYTALQLLPVLPAAVVFYGATRYHILGIDFIVNRAIVYAAMTAAVVGIIGLTEEGLSYWFVMNTNLAYALIIAITLVFATVVGHIRDAIRYVVDRVMFRDRLRARDRLDELAHELPNAPARSNIEYALTCEVQQALDLRCAALFELRGDHFVVVADAHWPASAASIPAEDPTMKRIVHGGMAEFLNEREWIGWHPDLRSVTPRFAVPIDVDSGAPFVAIYGLELSGVDIDVDEARSLEHLATGAAVGLSNLRTRELASHLEELEALRAENARLRALLGERGGEGGVRKLTEAPAPEG